MRARREGRRQVHDLDDAPFNEIVALTTISSA
jgi:hypothetical protein